MKKYLFLLPLLFIVVLAYCRYTFLINPNLSGEPFMLKIGDEGALNNHRLNGSSIIHARSILVYLILFFIANTAFFQTLFPKGKVILIIVLYLLISLFSGMLFSIDAFLLKSPVIFGMASTLKNFILTPMFTAAGYLMIVYFGKTGSDS